MNNARIAGGIQNPRISRPSPFPKGPTWKDVRRLLDAKTAANSAELRRLQSCHCARFMGLEAVKSSISLFVISIGSMKPFNWYEPKAGNFNSSQSSLKQARRYSAICDMGAHDVPAEIYL